MTRPPRIHRPLRLLAPLLLVLAVAGCGASGTDEDAKETTTTVATSTDEATTTSTVAEDTASTTTAATGLEEPATWATKATEHRGKDGETFSYDCPAAGEPATVWGVETYTDDSSVCTAAVQVGLIDLADGGTVEIEIAPGEDAYLSGTANGVTSTSYGSWGGSFIFPEAAPGSLDFEPSTEAWKTNASDSALEPGDEFRLGCAAGGEPGSVWGTGTYTADSSICTAAVHAGLITVADGGNVAIEIADGEDTYEGTEANGITTKDYGSYDKSYTFSKDQPDQ